jgi:hypothetical protein
MQKMAAVIMMTVILLMKMMMTPGDQFNFGVYSYGLEYPYVYTRNLRWWYVYDKRTGQACFFAPLFLGWRAEAHASGRCKELNNQWCMFTPVPLDEIDATA